MQEELDKLNKDLCELISTSVPKATSTKKYEGTLFTLKPEEKEGQFSGVFSYKTHVQISFSEGVHLDDPDELLCGKGQGRRHINIKSAEEFDAPKLKQALIKLIKQAAKLSGQSPQ